VAGGPSRQAPGRNGGGRHDSGPFPAPGFRQQLLLPVRQQVVSGYSAALDLRSLTAGTYHLLVFQSGKKYSKEFIIAK